MESTRSNKYVHIGKAERLELAILLAKGYTQRDIATALGRSHTSVGREIRRGRHGGDRRTPDGTQGSYEAASANHKAYVRRKYAKYQGKKINENPKLQSYIIQGLKQHWNPDEISGAMKREGQSFYASKTAIYEWLYSQWGQAYTSYLYTKRYRAKAHRTPTAQFMIPDRVSITKRPLGATNRTRYGHWEGDTMVSGKKTGSKAALAVAYERKARYVDVRKLVSLAPASFNQAVTAIAMTVTSMRSLSLDNGIENRHHAELGVPAFFCDPYSSWQKGGVEHANKMLRRYFPKGMDLADISEVELKRAVAIINNKPRKILGYQSALQVMTEKRLLVQT